MYPKPSDQRLRQLEDALLEYVERYGATTAALEAFRVSEDGTPASPGVGDEKISRFLRPNGRGRLD